MCLYNSKKIEKIDEDIICYKAFYVKRKGFKKIITSPVKSNYVWEDKKGELSFDRPEILDGDKIGAFAFHSFKEKDPAIRFAKYLDNYFNKEDGRFVVYECTIPKDTKFLYEGDNCFWVYCKKGWASQKLIIGKSVYKTRSRFFKYLFD